MVNTFFNPPASGSSRPSRFDARSCDFSNAAAMRSWPSALLVNVAHSFAMFAMDCDSRFAAGSAASMNPRMPTARLLNAASRFSTMGDSPENRLPSRSPDRLSSRMVNCSLMTDATSAMPVCKAGSDSSTNEVIASPRPSNSGSCTASFKDCHCGANSLTDSTSERMEGVMSSNSPVIPAKPTASTAPAAPKAANTGTRAPDASVAEPNVPASAPILPARPNTSAVAGSSRLTMARYHSLPRLVRPRPHATAKNPPRASPARSTGPRWLRVHRWYSRSNFCLAARFWKAS